ncbi:MAG: hypothetical protein VX000_11905, partial [Myxococcota bacterium]|nr:hypothetical protein [Myxococcota bacterium]
GLWLILLELTWVSFAWSWDPSFHYLGVLWALGASMLLLVPLTLLPRWMAVFLGVIGTLLLAAPGLEWDGPGTGFWLQRGQIELFGMTIRASYAAVPWFLTAAVGWGGAQWFVSAKPQRLALLGGGAALTGLVLRVAGLGNPRDWTERASGLQTALDLLHLDKYPPSLDFLLVFVGFGLLLLAGPMRMDGPGSRWLRALGRTSMFFYLLHLPLAHAAGNATAWLWFGTPRIPPGAPLRLWLVLVAWAAVLGGLTPLCNAWDRLKRRRRDLWWLSYL